MDSLLKLKQDLRNIENRNVDRDVIVTDQWFVITAWAKDVVKLDENIKETSLNHSHQIDRMGKAIQEIF